MTKRILILSLIISTIIVSSCSFNNKKDLPSSGFTGKYTSETAGYVTYYEDADSDSVAYYVPEQEEGWYHCAVSEPKYDDLLPGTAIELKANGKTINLLITDLCPSKTNSENTNNPNFFFDLEKSAFTYLADASVGKLDMIFKTIPYPTSKNIKIQIKDSSNEWWLSFRVFNMRYPLKSVEISKDGDTFVPMKSFKLYNWYEKQYYNGEVLSGKTYFRLTNIYGQVITTGDIGTLRQNQVYDLGVNFSN